jgi:hypothetical protein
MRDRVGRHDDLERPDVVVALHRMLDRYANRDGGRILDALGRRGRRPGHGGVHQARALRREPCGSGAGCATAPERVARERSGNPKLRLARVPRLGEIVEVRTKLDHDSDTGLSLKGGVYVRERPEFFVKQVRVYFDRDLVAHFTLTSAISANPILRFPVRVPRPGVLRVVFANNEGRRWEITEPVRPAG